MIRWLGASLLICIVVLLGILTASCGTDHSEFRLVHASSDAPNNLDAAVDGKTVITDLAFGNAGPPSGYLTVTAGNRRLEVRDTGTTDDRINSTASFAAGKQYTAVVSGYVPHPPDPPIDPGIAAIVLTDDNSAPPAGSVKLRILHAAPDQDHTSVDIYIVAPGTDITTVSPTISSLAYGQASDYQSVTPSSNQVQVIFTAVGEKSAIINQTYTLSGGQVRTLVTVNVQDGTTMAATPLVLNDLN